MPIKAKPVDPERARLAARGLWGRGRGGPTTSASDHRAMDAGRGRGGSCASCSSTSSDSASTLSAQGRDRRGRLTRDKGRAVAPVFVLTSREKEEGNSEASNSDPELYRAARERTARFLYSENYRAAKKGGESQNSSKNGYCGDTVMKEQVHCDMLANDANEEPVSAPLQSKVAAEENLFFTGQVGETGVEFGQHESSDIDANAPPVSLINLSVVQEALWGVGGTVYSEVRSDFNRLMDLFAADIQKEHLEKDKQISESDISKGSKKRLPNGDGGYISSDDILMDEFGQELQCDAPRPQPSSALTFADLQERALLQLYASSHGKENEKYFIATEHMAEAFTLAAMEAAQNRLQTDESVVPFFFSTAATKMRLSDSGGDSGCVAQPNGAPLTLLELVFAERARRNARAALRQGLDEDGNSFLFDTSADPLFCCDAEVLAGSAEASLERFFLGVRCIEAAICDSRVTNELGAFLFKHHMLFLETGRGVEAKANVVREFLPEAFTVYEKYSGYVSTFLAELLNRCVPNLNMEEFVLTLYDVSHHEDSNDRNVGDYVTMDVLSYSAWRLLQSISSFDQFVTFMDDFIAEEYGVVQETACNDGGEGDTIDTNAHRPDVGDVVVVAGARGIRALLKKSKAKATGTATVLSGNPLQVSSAISADAVGDSKSIDNEIVNNGGDVSFVAEATSSKASILEQERREQNESHAANVNCTRAESAQVSKRSLRSNVLPKQFCVPFGPVPNSSPLAGVELSRCSGAANIFLRSTKAARRPDAVPGRNLPPLSVIVAQHRDRSGSVTPRQSNASAGSDVRSQTVVGLSSPPVAGDGGAKKVECTRRAMGLSAPANQIFLLSSDANCGRRSKSGGVRKKGVVNSGASVNTKSRKKTGK